MRRATFVIAAILGSLSLATAQRNFTSPVGYDRNEGPDYLTLYTPWYDINGGRYQWSDSSQRGNLRPNINRLELRRDGLQPFTAAWGPRTTTVTVILGYCDSAALSLNFANNYIGTPTTCVSQMPLNIPDHTTPPATPPAPWTLSVPFTTNFNYLGNNDFLWEMICENSSAGGAYALDAHVGGAGTSTYIGTYCNQFNIYKLGPTPLPLNRSRLSQYALAGPPSQAAALLIGLTDPNTSFGGLLCQNLRANLDVVLPFATNSLGDIGSANAPINLDVPAPNFTTQVFTQFLAIDPASTFPIPVSLTDAVSWTLLTNPVAVSLLWYDGPNPATAISGFRRGPSAIARFTY